MECFANAMPFAELVKTIGGSRAAGGHPIFDVRFALQNHPVPDVEFPSLSARLRMRSTGTARFHLGCEITEDGDGLEVVWLARRTSSPRMTFRESTACFKRCCPKSAARPRAGRPPLALISHGDHEHPE